MTSLLFCSKEHTAKKKWIKVCKTTNQSKFACIEGSRPDPQISFGCDTAIRNSEVCPTVFTCVWFFSFHMHLVSFCFVRHQNMFGQILKICPRMPEISTFHSSCRRQGLIATNFVLSLGRQYIFLEWSLGVG